MTTRFSPGYLRYLRSEDWRRRRKAALIHANYRCELCGRSEGQTVLHVHHTSYKRLGHEKPSDLKVLCVRCHFWVTWLSRAWRFFKRLFR